VATAQGGKAGLEALEQAPPDVLLTDIRMPGLTGIELLAAARQQDPELPVILMTAQAELRTAIDAVNQGAFQYIQKPFETAALVAVCRQALEHRRRARVRSGAPASSARCSNSPRRWPRPRARS
jgi:DNA-binding NtrC family response regulator